MPLPNSELGYLSLAELADRWAVARETVVGLYVKNGLKGTYIGGRWFFTIPDADEFEQKLVRDWKGRIKILMRRIKRIQDHPLIPDEENA
jgi:hypothetical protein